MTPENFTYWLQGFLEIQNPITIDARQLQIIKDHISLVFKKETPQRFYFQNIDIPKVTFSVPPQTDGLTDFTGVVSTINRGSC